MSGERNLETLLQQLDAQLHEDVFVFVTCQHDEVPHDLVPQMQFYETEGLTMIMRLEEAHKYGFSGEFASRMITLNIHSALDAVGFIAHIASVLAAAGMGVNPVAGFFHDHLFVPEDRVDEAMALLTEIRAKACRSDRASSL